MILKKLKIQEKLLKSLFLALLISSITNILLLTAPLYMMAIFDKVMLSFHIETLYLISLLAVISLITYGLVDWCRTQLLFRLGNWFESQLIPATLEASLAVTHQGKAVGAQGIRDLSQVKSVIAGRTLLPLLDAPWALIFLVILFIMNTWLGAFTLITACVLFTLTCLSEFSTRQHQARFQNQQNQSQIWLDHSIKHADEVIALGMQDALISGYQEKRFSAQKNYILSQTRSSSLLALAKTIRMLAQIGIMGLAAYLLLQGEVSPGMVVSGSILMSRALSPIEQLMGAWNQLLIGRHAYTNLVNLLAASPTPASTKAQPPKPSNTLSVKQLSVLKSKDAPIANAQSLPTYILQGIEFHLEKGDRLAILGASGAGKTSLGKALVGLLKANMGKITLDGYALNQWSAKSLAQHIGYLPQEVNLAQVSIWENIARLDKNASMEEVYLAAKKAGVHEFIQQLPNGYNTKLTLNTPQLSGGQKQGIALARALYQNPFMLVLDEPDAFLDSKACEALKTCLTKLSQEGCLIIFISHKPNMIDVATKAIILDKGRLIAKGPKDEILKALQQGRSANTMPPPHVQSTNSPPPDKANMDYQPGYQIKLSNQASTPKLNKTIGQA